MQAEIGKFTLVGHMGMFLPGPRPADVIMNEESVVGIMRYCELRELCGSRSDMALKVRISLGLIARA